MFRANSTYDQLLTRFPRVRGDVPLAEMISKGLKLFSPRARGCSVLVTLSFSEDKVFPACAGMFHATAGFETGID